MTRSGAPSPNRSRQHAGASASAGPLADIDVVILAGGLGTRLQSVIPGRQKVIASVRGRPFIAYLVDHFHRAGCRQIVLAVGYGADQVRSTMNPSEWGDGLEIQFSVEARPLGTAGALRYALPLLRRDTVLVANGDSFAAIDMKALVDAHRRRRAVCTLALTEVAEISRYGRIELGPGDRVRSFIEKPPPNRSGNTARGLINAGLYLLKRSVVGEIHAKLELSLERDVLPRYIGRGLYGLRTDAPFIDIGTPASLAAAASFFDSLDKVERRP